MESTTEDRKNVLSIPDGRRSIKNSILKSVLTVFALLYIPMFLYIFQENKNDVFASARIEALSTARILAVALYRNYEIETDIREIQAFIVGAKRSTENILELSVMGLDFEVVSSTDEKRIGTGELSSRYEKVLKNEHVIDLLIENLPPQITVLYPVSASVDKSNAVTGVFELHLDATRYVNQLRVIRHNLILAGILIFVAITIAIVRISESITIPIRKLYEGMSRANEGDLSIRVEVQSKDEVGYATETFNTMLASIQKSDNELRENAAEMQRMNEHLTRLSNRLKDAERLEVIGTLTSVIAHQLKNPLSIIRGGIDSIKRRSSELSEDIVRFLNILEHESKRTGVVVERFLAFAKKQELQKRPVQIEHLMKEAMASFAAPTEGVEIILTSGVELPIVEIDRDLVLEVLLNVLENAREALTSEEAIEPTIEIALDVVGEEVVISISDNGAGIPGDILTRVFDPFFSTKSKGSGLGLSMAKKILILHGGGLSIENRSNAQGVVVKISIPFYKEA